MRLDFEPKPEFFKVPASFTSIREPFRNMASKAWWINHRFQQHILICSRKDKRMQYQFVSGIPSIWLPAAYCDTHLLLKPNTVLTVDWYFMMSRKTVALLKPVLVVPSFRGEAGFMEDVSASRVSVSPNSTMR